MSLTIEMNRFLVNNMPIPQKNVISDRFRLVQVTFLNPRSYNSHPTPKKIFSYRRWPNGYNRSNINFFCRIGILFTPHLIFMNYYYHEKSITDMKLHVKNKPSNQFNSFLYQMNVVCVYWITVFFIILNLLKRSVFLFREENNLFWQKTQIH